MASDRDPVGRCLEARCGHDLDLNNCERLREARTRAIRLDEHPIVESTVSNALDVIEQQREWLDSAVIGDLRVSEMTLIGKERFLVIERTDQATALHEIDLAGATNILGTRWDDTATNPTLEQHGLAGFPTLGAAGIVPVRKTLRVIASSLPGAEPRFARKLEGLGFTQEQRLILVNDDDFGITGERLQVDVVRGAGFGKR